MQGLTKPACREPLRVGQWSGSGPSGELEPLAFEGTQRRIGETVPSAPSLRDEADSAARPLPYCSLVPSKCLTVAGFEAQWTQWIQDGGRQCVGETGQEGWEVQAKQEPVSAGLLPGHGAGLGTLGVLDDQAGLSPL